MRIGRQDVWKDGVKSCQSKAGQLTNHRCYDSATRWTTLVKNWRERARAQHTVLSVWVASNINSSLTRLTTAASLRPVRASLMSALSLIREPSSPYAFKMTPAHSFAETLTDRSTIDYAGINRVANTTALRWRLLLEKLLLCRPSYCFYCFTNFCAPSRSKFTKLLKIFACGGPRGA
jgi:hypothetical protein